MDYYRLDDNFQPTNLIETATEKLWIERYSEPGDLSFKFPLTRENVDRYPLTTKIQRVGGKEVMIITSREIENGILTVKGKSLLNILSRRTAFPGDEILEYVGTTEVYEQEADQFASVVFGNSVRDGGGGGNPASVNSPPTYGDSFTITNLDQHPDLGDPSWVGPVIPVSFSAGQSYLDALIPAAKDAKMGVTIYLDSIGAPGVFQLYFNAYFGTDRTAALKFSEQDGDLTNVKVLESDESYAGFVFVYIPAYVVGGVGIHPWYLSVNEAGAVNTGSMSSILGWNKSSIVIPMSEVTEEDYVDDPTTLLLMEARARAELVARRKIYISDGEIASTAKYKFGEDYFMGDLVSLESSVGVVSEARITEYIWASDATGEREYPTIEIEE